MLIDYSPNYGHGAPAQPYGQGRTPVPFGTRPEVAKEIWAKDAARGGGAIPPMIPVQVGPGQTVMAPNPAFGQAHGLQWDGSGWVRPDPNLDLQRKMLEMEMDRRRQEMEQERWKREQERMATEWALGQQMNPAKQLAPMPAPRPDTSFTPGRPDQMSPEDRLAFNKKMVQMYQKQAPKPAAPGMAEPIQPPDNGTPYGGSQPTKPASSFGFKPPPAGSINYAVMEWWHNPSTRQETQATAGSIAPTGWKKGRLPTQPAAPKPPPAPRDWRAGDRAPQTGTPMDADAAQRVNETARKLDAEGLPWAF